MQSSLPVEPIGRNIKTADAADFAEVAKIVEAGHRPCPISSRPSPWRIECPWPFGPFGRRRTAEWMMRDMALQADGAVLIRTPAPERPDCWHIYHGDVHAGTIAKRVGVPWDEDPWG